MQQLELNITEEEIEARFPIKMKACIETGYVYNKQEIKDSLLRRQGVEWALNYIKNKIENK